VTGPLAKSMRSSASRTYSSSSLSAGRFTGVELAGHAAVQDGERGGADVFGQLEVLVEAEAEGLEVVGCGALVELIVPATDDGLPLSSDVAHGGLPAIARGELAAFDDAAAGKAQEAGVHVVEQLHEVFAQAVGAAVLPGVDGEERDHVEIERAGFVDGEIELRAWASVALARMTVSKCFQGPEPSSFECAAADFVAGFVGERGADGFGAGACERRRRSGTPRLW
jgi:hypothetical protein